MVLPTKTFENIKQITFMEFFGISTKNHFLKNMTFESSDVPVTS